MPVREKAFTDVVLGEILVRKSSRCGRYSIRISPRSGIVVGIPVYASFTDGLAFLASKKEWVIKTVRAQSAKVAGGLPSGWQSMSENERATYIEELRKSAKAFLPSRISDLAAKYGFSYAKVFIKHNVSNWGSCSRSRNINLNLNLMRTSSEECTYVILHELCHLKYMNHGRDFHSLLDRLCLEETGLNASVLSARLKKYTLV